MEMVQKDTFKVPSGISLPLGTEGLGVLGDGACQLPSNSSLIVTHENTLYKYNVDTTERTKMQDFFTNCTERTKPMLVTIWHEEIWLQKFPGLPHAYFLHS